jgi:hypothetical protein
MVVKINWVLYHGGSTAPLFSRFAVISQRTQETAQSLGALKAVRLKNAGKYK